MDSQANGIDPERAQKIVQAVTRFATSMCVVIAFVKIGVYLKSHAAVVKTSALDSCGDLIANMITLYTGYRMSTINPKEFPVGQSRFEAIGVLIFSVLMAAMMFGNALSNIESLSEVAEKNREESIMDFWKAMFGEIKHVKDETTYVNYETGFREFKNAISAGTGGLTEILQQVMAAGNFDDATKAVKETIEEAAEVPNASLVWSNLLFQNIFLGCCATYKCGLWLFTLLWAIPNTGSTVLHALANDKRNDFIATTFVIITSFIAYAGADTIKDFMDPDKVDPLCSLILSSVIIYTWVCLVLEQIVVLSASSVEHSLLNHISMLANNCIKDAGNQFDSECKAYYSSSKQTIEVELVVIDPQLPFKEVSNTMSKVKHQMDELDNIERTIVVPRSA